MCAQAKGEGGRGGGRGDGRGVGLVTDVPLSQSTARAPNKRLTPST